MKRRFEHAICCECGYYKKDEKYLIGWCRKNTKYVEGLFVDKPCFKLAKRYGNDNKKS